MFAHVSASNHGSSQSRQDLLYLVTTTYCVIGGTFLLYL